MVKVRLKTTKNLNSFEKYSDALHKQWFLWQNEVFELGEKTVEVMRKRIEETRKREKGKIEGLASLIEMEVLDMTGKIHFGIGNIEKIKEKAPYYNFINYGGKLPAKPVPSGIFSNFPKPDKNVPQTGRWLVGQEDEIGQKYTFIPKKVVEGKHYIEAGVFFFARKLKEIYQKYVRMTRRESRKNG